MKSDSSTESWSKVTDEWISHAQTNDYRLNFIMPYTLGQLGDVSGKSILDIGCGEGGYSRALAKAGAIVTAVDCAESLIEYSKMQSDQEQLKISHYVRNSNDLVGLADEAFDIVLSSMMLMDCEDFEGTIREITRVLKPKGYLFASVMHPCFSGMNIKPQMIGNERKVVAEDYFHPSEWEEKITSDFKNPVIFRHRTLQEYVKAFVKCGLTIADLDEPVPTKEQAELSTRIARLNKIPMFLFLKLVK